MIRIGVIRGGQGPTHDWSIKNGERVLRSLVSDSKKTVDIILTKDGKWILRGLSVNPNDIPNHVDVIFDTTYTPDFKIHSEVFMPRGIKLAGTSQISSFFSNNRLHNKEQLRRINVKTPKDINIPQYVDDSIDFSSYVDFFVKEVHKEFPGPWLVNLISSGQGHPIIAKSLPELQEIFAIYLKTTDILVEQQVFGKKIIVHTLENYRGQPIYTFLPIEICSPGVCKKARFDEDMKREIQDISRRIHKSFGFEKHSTIEFIVGNLGIYCTFANNRFPDLTEGGTLKTSLDLVGGSVPDFLNYILD